MSWEDIACPDKKWAVEFAKALQRLEYRNKQHRDFVITPKSQLKMCSKTELISKVRALQNTIRQCAVNMGIARNKKNSEYTINADFINNIREIILITEW